MKRKRLGIILVLSMMISLFPAVASAAYQPPAVYNAPANAGVVFNGDNPDRDATREMAVLVSVRAYEYFRN